MFTIRAASSRIVVSRVVTSTTSRALSSQGEAAVDKLKLVLAEYRNQHYTQETPMRFRKDIVAAAKQKTSDRVALDGMQRVLANIGAENRLSQSEIKIIFEELGNGHEIPVDRVSQLI